MGFCFWVCFGYSLLFVSLQAVAAAEGDAIVEGTVYIDGKAPTGTIDDDFVCATLDWWPPEKCDYGTCSWGRAGLLNLDLNNNIFLNAVKAFSPLKIRLGGSLQDKVIYGTDDNREPCNSFVQDPSEMFGFTKGCLPMKRWDELNAFFAKAGAKIIVGLNALAGKSIKPGGSAVGAWNYTNAESFIRYTVEKNYKIHGWELGNELSGNGVGTRIAANQYAADTAALQRIVQKIYKDVDLKPLIIAPGGFYESKWFKEFIDKTTTSLDVITHHIYNLGPGVDTHLIEKILNPSVLDGISGTFSGLHNVIKSSATKAIAWVGEAGGAYNSGRNLVTNAFVFSFWYLDQLGMASKYDTKTYCRQSLIGGNYGLLDTSTFVPNPDYYSALLWHRLMGRNVLSTSFDGTKKIRSYTHCAKQSEGIVVLFINVDKSTTVKTKLAFNSTMTLRHNHESRTLRIQRMSSKKMIIELPQMVDAEIRREEYHLTAKDGNLQSRTMLLNGNILSVDSSENIPPLEPLYVNSAKPITVEPLSIVFIHLSDVILPACKLKNSRAANEVEGYGHDLIVSERQVLDWNTRLFLRVCPKNQRNLNLWPENPHNFRDILPAYFPKVKQMMDLLFKAMAKSLDLEKNSFLGQFGVNPVMQVRFNFYPHSDRSGVTVLLQDEEVEGLQIVKDGAWITVPLIPRALVVNLGDQMQIMSNRIFKSPVHKAVTNTDKRRISLAMSNEADVDKEIGPVEALIDD